MTLNKFIFRQYSKLSHGYFHAFRMKYYKKRYKEDFENVPVFCLFLGYPRSGHTLIGSLLNAHPEMLIAHELHVLELIQKGYTDRDTIFAKLIAQAKWFSSRNEKWTGYSYKVKGQWQGKFRKLKVIGDKRGGGSSRLLYEDMTPFLKLKEIVGKKVKVIHVTRNPFDNIATRARGGNYYQRDVNLEKLKTEIQRHFNEVEAINKAKQYEGFEWIEFKHEDFIDDPKTYLHKLCNFLEVEPFEDYITDCLKIIRGSKSKSRNKIQWTEELKQLVAEKSKQYSFLQDYSFEAGV